MRAMPLRSRDNSTACRPHRVAPEEGANQTQLVRRTGIDRSTVADIVRRMLRKGLLQHRRTKHDARAYAVKLTAEGHRMLRTAAPLGRHVDQRVLDALPGKRPAQFIDALIFIVSRLQGSHRRKSAGP